MPRASNAVGASNAASNPRVAWTVAVAALAVLAGRELQRAGTCALHPKDEARAAALVEAEVGRLWAASSRAADDADAQLKLLTKELIDVEKLASSLVGRAHDDAEAVAAAIEAAPAPADKNSDDAWAEARRLAEAARADADAASASAEAASKDAQQAAQVAAAAKPRDETLAEIESAAVAVEERSRQATTALAEAAKQLAAAEEASSQLQKELKRTPPASVSDRALRKAVDEVTEAAAKAAAARRGGRESTNDVKALVETAIDDFFDGDRVGRFDYALQAAGARVVPSLTSEPYTPRGALIPTKVWHALGLDAGVGPAAAPPDRTNPEGAEGKLTVRLSRPVRPTHFSVEHLHAALCDPARNANCSSAPKAMDVVGRGADGDVVEFGSFSYAASSDAPTVQTFAAASLGERVDAVTLRVKSNHGHPDYTCLYRFRVHGDE
jgi:hypothetical protein